MTPTLNSIIINLNYMSAQISWLKNHHDNYNYKSYDCKFKWKKVIFNFTDFIQYLKPLNYIYIKNKTIWYF